MPETLTNPVLFTGGPEINELDIAKQEGNIESFSVTMQPKGGFLMYTK